MTYEQLDAAGKAAKERADEFKRFLTQWQHKPDHPTVLSMNAGYLSALTLAEAFFAARDVTPK